MAAIPTYLFLGDAQLNGQYRLNIAAEVEILFSRYTARSAVPSLMQEVPSQANGAPFVSPNYTYLPWWDGQFNNGVSPVGQWIAYSHVAAADGGNLAHAGGDNWYTATAGNPTVGTFGATISLMQFLKARHGNSAPGFKMFKRAFANGIAGANGWGNAGGGNWTTFASEWADAQSKLGAGDTTDIKALIIDGSATDLANVTSAATYKTALQSFITKIRASTGSGGLGHAGLIIIVNHDANLYKTTAAGFANAYREVHAELAANAAGVSTYNNIRLVDMSGASFAPASALTNMLEDTDPSMYSTQEYIEQGYRIGVTIESFYKAAPVANPGSGLATYFLIGDSQAKGQVSPFVAVFGAQASILGPYNPGNPTATTRQFQYIWNGVTNLIEPYNVMANANTLPASEATINYFGPEATFMKRLAEEHGDNGFLVIKMAKNGAALTLESDLAGASSNYEKAGGDLYSQLVAAWNRVKIDMVTPRSGWSVPRVPDVRGIAVLLGDNDTYTTDTATAFAAKVGTFVTNLCADFRTRTDTAVVPIAWHKVPKGIDEGGQSGLGSQAARTAVRAALANLAAARSTYVSIAETDDLELRRDETPKVHYAGEANYEIGYRLADALLALSAAGAAGDPGVDAGGEDTGEDGPPPEGATLVVEDGTGLASANSYISLADANTYLEGLRNPAAWTEADDSAKEQALRVATAYLDDRYGDQWVGIRNGRTQALDWPRSLAYDLDGYAIDNDEVPKRLKNATAEMALRYLVAPDELMPDVAVDDQGIASESNTVGPISQSVTYQSGKSYSKRFTNVERMLKTGGLIESDTWANR